MLKYLKCFSCLRNNKNTTIKINSNCMSKPVNINIHDDDIESLDILENLLFKLSERKKESIRKLSIVKE